MNLFRRLERVWRLAGIRSHQRLVLLNLAYRADEQSLSCYPSAGRVAADTGMTRHGVQKLIKELANRKLITVMSSGRGKGRNAPNHYHLDFLRMDHPVGNLAGDEWPTAETEMANGTPGNGSPGWHEPLKHKRTARSASAPAPEARAARRERNSDSGRSAVDSEQRVLLEIASMHGWERRPGEGMPEYLRRITRMNQQRIERLNPDAEVRSARDSQ
ncbi:MAG: hypothetical protein U1F09_02125 [Steroidobacteraceae bacterium]